MSDDFFADLHKDIETTRPEPKPETFKCASCGGSGRFYSNRTGRDIGECFSCKGSGEHRLSPHDQRKRKASRAKAKVTQANNEAERRMTFDADYPGAREAMRGIEGWARDGFGEFIRSMNDELSGRCKPTPKMLASILRTVAKCDRNAVALVDGWRLDDQPEFRIELVTIAKTKADERQARAEARAEQNKLDAAPIHTLFDKAKARGIKKPGYNLGNIRVTLAPAHGRNAGCLYVKFFGEYAGKIKDGVFMPYSLSTEDRAEVLKELRAMAEDPEGAAMRHGRETGSCSVCGRTLTVKASIEAGIGPVCATKWFG